MAYRFYSDTVTSSIDNATLVDTTRSDVVTFTRSATYIAGGRNAHVLNLRLSASAVIDGALYSADGATVQGRVAGSDSTVRVGETGLVSSAAGPAFDMAGAAFALFNRGQISGYTGVGSSADSTNIVNDGAITGLQTGVLSASVRTTITNHGAIAGQAAGLYLSGGSDGQVIANDGRITGGTTAGIFVLASGDISITNSGTIDGRIGVSLLTYLSNDVGAREIVNHGTLNGSYAAINGSEAADSVWNDGTITGAVYLNGGNDAFDGRGGIAGRVFGGTGDDVLTGSDLGRDVLSGGDGNDRLFGGAGNDVLMPGTGTDYVDGGAGRDILSFRDYTIDVEYVLYTQFGSPALDINFSSIEGLEGGSGNDRLSGDNNDNWLYGNAGNDILNGNGGSDVMIGGTGNDYYYVGPVPDQARPDVVIEIADEGIDTIYSSIQYNTLPSNVENLTLVFGGNGLTAWGNALDNVIIGNTGNNSFAGNAGNFRDSVTGSDRFTGGGGADLFELASTGVATITDFGSDDKFELYRVLGFAGLTAGVLQASAFWVGTAAHDADDRIIFNTTNNTLYYDADGTGGIAPIVIGILGTEVTPTASMFTIY